MPSQPNQVWAGDIAFIPTASGWLYLAVILDLYSRKVASRCSLLWGSLRLAVSLRSAVGWSAADNLRTPLVVDALRQAVGSRRALPHLIFHSDRGSQYGTTAYRQLLREAGIRQSISARANPYHNAWTEAFMGTLKTEVRKGGTFRNHSDTRIELFAYIETYYNTRRKHSALGYQSPASYKAQINNN